MTEEVNTGGLKKFVYPNEKPNISVEFKKSIEQGYQKYHLRKRKEKITIVVIITILVLSILGWISFKAITN